MTWPGDTPRWNSRFREGQRPPARNTPVSFPHSQARSIRAGFYLWGCYDRKKYWHSIYLGKAGFGKTAHLRARISAELRDERWFIWRHVLSEEGILKMSDQIFSGRYHKECERAMRKAGATHIIWVPAPRIENEEITRVEADLIEALNPKANIIRPTPPHNVQEEATQIFGAFRRTIHAARKTAFVGVVAS